MHVMCVLACKCPPYDGIVIYISMFCAHTCVMNTHCVFVCSWWHWGAPCWKKPFQVQQRWAPIRAFLLGTCWNMCAQEISSCPAWSLESTTKRFAIYSSYTCKWTSEFGVQEWWLFAWPCWKAHCYPLFPRPNSLCFLLMSKNWATGIKLECCTVSQGTALRKICITMVSGWYGSHLQHLSADAGWVGQVISNVGSSVILCGTELCTKHVLL